MHRRKMSFLFLFFAPCVMSSEEKSYLSKVESNFEKFCDITNYVTEYLEDFNDRHLGESVWGKMLGYEEIKPRITDDGNSRGLKKMSAAMMPLVFHVGATSTWMVLTAIMAAKSVAIGLILLVFKIAVSSAKIASFFTLLKSKNSASHHEHAWIPHGHDRSLNEIHRHDWSSYSPEWSSSDTLSGYKTVPAYRENHISRLENNEDYEDTNTNADEKKQ